MTPPRLRSAACWAIPAIFRIDKIRRLRSLRADSLDAMTCGRLGLAACWPSSTRLPQIV